MIYRFCPISVRFFPVGSAEKAGFEPAIHFWRIHAFQACLFNHSSISPLTGCKSKESFCNKQMFDAKIKNLWVSLTYQTCTSRN